MTSKLTRRFLLGGASAVAIIAGAALQAATFDFSYTGAIATGTIADAGTYRVSIGGASGGGGFLSSGGTGASILGDVYLGAGMSFSVLVGGDGATTYSLGGGGGMSYFRAGSSLAVAGGGGGGAIKDTSYTRNFDGSITYNSPAGSGDGLNGGASATAGGTRITPFGYTYLGGAAGTIGATGGGAARDSSGGAGFYHDGAAPSWLPGSEGKTGPSWAGGTNPYKSNFGGFGGGGSAYFGGGGGGGFVGGGGGALRKGGGGGSSHFSVDFFGTSITDGGATNGAYVSLDLIEAAPAVPLPAGILFMGTALAGFGAMRQRKKS